jgi:hypothetical protein
MDFPEVRTRPEQNMASILSHLEDRDARRAVNVHALAAAPGHSTTYEDGHCRRIRTMA